MKTNQNKNEGSGSSPQSTTTTPHSNPEIINDQPAIESHVKNLCKLAEDAGEGVLIVASYGQNPMTGKDLSPKVSHFKPSDHENILSRILQLSKQLHRNIYMPLVLMRSDLLPGKKGGISDIVSVFGLVADFDDADADKWPDRIPCPPSYVLETSPGRFQVGFLFDDPMSPDNAKKSAVALKRHCNCDHGTADISHVWRIPGTLNWPNKLKVDTGRSQEPFLVKHFEEVI
jgi:hypothetical protein